MSSRKGTIAGWAMYDVANSSYHLMFPTIIMPLLARQYVFSSSRSADFYWALLVSLPVIAAGLTGPFFGAWADRRGTRVESLALLAASAILSGAVTAIPHPLAIVLGFAVSYYLFTLSLGLYDSLLPAVADRSRHGRISGAAWGLGYLGGIVTLAIVAPLLKGKRLPEDLATFGAAILIVCGVFAGAAVVAFALLWRARNTLPRNVAAEGVAARVASTLMHWRQSRRLLLAIVSYFLANDGLSTVVYFTSIYAATTLGFSNEKILILFLVVQVVAVPATIAGGALADRHGARRVLLWLLTLWCVTTIGFAVSESLRSFYVLSVATGLLIGTTPSVYRALIAGETTLERSSEQFGFTSFASRASAVLGPLTFGAVAAGTGSQRIAMVTLLGFFAAAGILLFRLAQQAPQVAER